MEQESRKAVARTPLPSPLDDERIRDANDLIEVLVSHACHAAMSGEIKQVVFVFGAALSAPQGVEVHGVPGVAEFVRLIAKLLGNDGVGGDGNPAEQYQRAMAVLRDGRSAEAARTLVQQAVLRALKERRVQLPDDRPLTPDEIGDIEFANPERWHLNSGLLALGQMLADYPRLFPVVLTSNFDPLIEVAVRVHGGVGQSMDDPSAVRKGADAVRVCEVVHFNGWYQTDPLHSPWELTSRPSAAEAISRLLAGKIVVVCAYGGWDDPFCQALELLARDDVTTEVHWACLAPREAIIDATRHIWQRLDGLLHAARAKFYAGVEIREFLQRLSTRLHAEVPRGHFEPPSKPSAESPDGEAPNVGHRCTSDPPEVSTRMFVEGRAFAVNFDAAWSMDRSAYVGISYAPSGVDVLDALVHGEQMLWDAQHARHGRLLARIWIGLRDAEDAVLSDAQELATIATARSRVRAQHLVSGAAWRRPLVGFVIPLSSGAPTVMILRAVRWAARLRSLFSERQPAVILASDSDRLTTSRLLGEVTAAFQREREQPHVRELALRRRGHRDSARGARGSREALALAVSEGDVEIADECIDAWLAAADVSEIDHLDLPIVDMHAGRLGEWLALGLMRRIAVDSDTRYRRALEKVLESCGARFLRAQTAWCDDPSQVFHALDLEGWTLAVRAGALPWPTVERFDLTGLTDVDFWSFVRSLPFDERRVRDLLELPARKRAVFGLCSAAEWQDLALDYEAARAVLACRSADALAFRPSPSD